VSWPRVLLGIWIVLTIGWLVFSGFFVWKLWPQYDRFFQTPGNPLYGAMVRKHLTEHLALALVPPIVSLLIGWLVLWAVRGPRR
jgi:hypothetical protein